MLTSRAVLPVGDDDDPAAYDEFGGGMGMMGMGMDEDGMVAGMEMLYDENGEPLEDGAGFGEQEEEGWVEVCGTVLEESGKEGPNSVVYGSQLRYHATRLL